MNLVFDLPIPAPYNIAEMDFTITDAEVLECSGDWAWEGRGVLFICIDTHTYLGTEGFGV